MGRKHILFMCAVQLCLTFTAVNAQDSQKARTSVMRFTCQGRGAGYYADVDTGCQVYHMCDGLGRQFSYKCPNMTLFQQRMLICDHWYMVNCSMSERDYNANLLIGQRDKPFVSDDEMRLRTPRPDILSAPPYNPYYDIVKEAETKYPIYSGNTIVGVADVVSNGDYNDLDNGKQNYRPPTGWSTGRKSNTKTNTNFGSKKNSDSLDEAASQEPDATFRPTPRSKLATNKQIPSVTPPSIDLIPPAPPTTETSSQEDSSIQPSEDSVFKFIKRFDPTSPDALPQTAMSKSEIIDLNIQLPPGQVSSEEERTPRKNKNFGNSLNTFNTENDKSFSEGTRFDSVNTKSSQPAEEPVNNSSNAKQIPEPEKVLLPPKTDYEPIPSTTVGPPIYYEWKWAVPAFDLIPPKEGNKTNDTSIQVTRSILGKSPFSAVTRPEPKTTTPQPSNVEYNISSYFVPDYVFPLDSPHPGYESDDAQTSFRVKVARPGRQSYGENPDCPQCHPAYLKSGTCEPCIVKR